MLIWCPVVITTLAIYQAHTTQTSACPIKKSDHIRATYTMCAPNLKFMHRMPTYLSYLKISCLVIFLVMKLFSTFLDTFQVLGLCDSTFSPLCTRQRFALLFALNHNSLVCFLAINLFFRNSITDFKLRTILCMKSILWEDC